MSQLLSSSTVDQYAGSCLVPKTEWNNHVSFHGVKSDSLTKNTFYREWKTSSHSRKVT